MKAIRWLDENIEKVILVFFSIIMVAVIFLQVVMRQFGGSLSWSEELARYCFIWLIYIGISFGVKQQKHVKIDALLFLLKDKGQISLTIISNLFFMLFAIFVILYGYEVANQLLQFGQKSPANQIPMGLVYMATPIGMGLTLIRLIQNQIDLIKSLFNKGKENNILN
ncbi:TRAP transporter small permease [Bacillus tuaregi]|uniref:TRAP transporter small permease n=1 Tax=Bacillus tuaregi TaxID=1816695 RepID=UPI0008F94103|nr:TRAP transporter small permease [Bacillus tuaregi]